MASSLPTFSHVQQAAKILQVVVYQTPVLRSSFLDDRCGDTLFLKCENFQRTGALNNRGQTRFNFPNSRILKIDSGVEHYVCEIE